MHMQRINDIASKRPDVIELVFLGWLEKVITPGFIRRGDYLLTEDPGIGKTTLVIQVLGDLASTFRAWPESAAQPPNAFTTISGRFPVRGSACVRTVVENARSCSPSI